MGIPGNKHANKEAKRGAEGRETELQGLPFLNKPLKTSRAVVLARHKKRWRAEAEEKLRASPMFGRLKAIYTNTPSMKTITQTLASILRRQALSLMQLRTGHCPLNHYLHWFKKSDMPTCPACHQADEMVKHFLLHCSAHARQWHELSKIVDLETEALSKLLSNAKSAKALFQYINSMGHFKRTYGDLKIIEGMTNSKPKEVGRKGRK
ncbi:hypothetical protein J132_02342 [Termitomyces sp. J132]|nr:hypothetical protein J132_02342 [Termitomyces sp. J132]